MEDWKSLFKLAMDAKCRAHLENGRKRVQFQITPDMKEHISGDIDRIVNYEISKMLADTLIRDVDLQKQKEFLDNGNEQVSLDLMVFPTEILWDIVKLVVTELSLEQIGRIKNI